MHKLTALLTTLVCVGTVSVHAEDPNPSAPDKPSCEHKPPGMIPENHFPKFGPLERLDLTQDQKTQIQKLGETERQPLLEARDKVHIAREILEAAIREHPEDELNIKAKAADLGAAVAALVNEESLHQSKFMQVLTGEQREKLEMVHRRHGAHFGPHPDAEDPEHPDKPEPGSDESSDESPEVH
jgi:Spy/CpxP family protein refolding chaperone